MLTIKYFRSKVVPMLYIATMACLVLCNSANGVSLVVNNSSSEDVYLNGNSANSDHVDHAPVWDQTLLAPEMQLGGPIAFDGHTARGKPFGSQGYAVNTNPTNPPIESDNILYIIVAAGYLCTQLPSYPNQQTLSSSSSAGLFCIQAYPMNNAQVNFKVQTQSGDNNGSDFEVVIN